ncbi:MULTISPECIES: helix-turn-helix domain-containing protein [Streptomyces]|jgi:transcriptional regulator with XRE-family HTH domain|uniref:Helix-turn-helix transcriptional regulator n=1 Tax=Streptomyces doudnae TaxID=3075536 RepID=A0ABD5EUB5_9ACTN|nr:MULTISPECIES: helix-turn-helix transcriptional regulator [unclassified Streptomyces]MDT0438253.1 helix-turn-helix transcriptional regulator [Streptomyces sp. DSM 41981]MYQ66016.1 helix-turn-helix domain-containing protein [Streptomyces sp. SID4950]SCE12358.1 Helix-turn-helix domain-containing protein [Streptomyces sp. SolWspMP-5a-2]
MRYNEWHVGRGQNVGSLLREWRTRRRMSQLELASRADSSARHISFIETGRASPSRNMLLRFADQMDIPIRERNVLLVAAGFAPHFPESSFGESDDLSVLRTELRRLLVAYEPNPVLIHDAQYHLVEANGAFHALVADVADHLLAPPLNVMRLSLHPEGLAPRIRRYPVWRAHLLGRLRHRLTVSGSAPLRALYDEVSGYPLPPGRRGEDSGTLVEGDFFPYALPLLLEHEGQVLSLVSALMTLSAPTEVTVSELEVETFLPANAETAEALQALRTEVTRTEAGRGIRSPS